MTTEQAFTLALQHHQAGRLGDAEALYRQILAAQPRHAEARHFLGVIAHQAGRHDLAIELIGQAIALKPNHPAAHSNLGEAYHSIGQWDEAISSYRRALELQPNSAAAHNNLGNALSKQRKYDEAIAEFRQALELQPDLPEAYNNLGNALSELGRLDEAMTALLHALRLKPDYSDAHNNLGIALAEQGRSDEAVAAYHRALDLQSNNASARFNLSLQLLRSGDYMQGWPLFESRWEALHCVERRFPQPRWDGSVLHGQRVLTYTEQGYGDSIQFIRYARWIADRGGEVIVECPRPLAEFFRTAKGVCEVVAPGDALPPFDLHVPLLSLPLVCQTTVETIPRKIPYLFAESARVETWRARLGGDRPRLRVGLAWAGNPKHIRDRARSLQLPQLLPLIGLDGVDFFSVQMDLGAESLGQLSGVAAIVDHTADIHDFADTAAFLGELDLIISVDTALVHLAGALGRPVWTLLPFVPDWRWGSEGEIAPWYPTVRLFRQPAAGDWDSVVRRVGEELGRIVIERALPQ